MPPKSPNDQTPKPPDMKRLSTVFVLVLLSLSFSLAQDRIRVACIGNSITYGHGIEDRDHDTYPAQLQTLLGNEFDVRNFGVSGTTAQKAGDFPWTTTNEYPKSVEFRPDIAVFKLGTNDSKPQNWVSVERFIHDLEALVCEYEARGSRVIIALPAKAYAVRWDINDNIIAQYELPALKKMAKKHHWQVIDLYKVTSNKHELFPDDIHPNEEGAGLIAKHVAKAVRKEAKKVRKNRR